MNRSQVYTGEVPRSYDFLKGWRRAFEGVGFALTDLIGGFEDSAAGTGGSGFLGDNLYRLLLNDHGGVTAASPLNSYAVQAAVAGFAITINSSGATPTAFAVTVDPGSVYYSMKTDLVQTGTAPADSPLYPANAGALTGFGDIAADATAEAVQFIVPAAVFGPLAKPGSGSYFFLIEVVPAQLDTTDSDDPNVSGSAPYNAVLPYYNAANRAQPLQGPGGTNPPTQQPSSRQATGLVQLSANSPQTSAAALVCDGGALPLYVIQIDSTDSTIASAHAWAAGLGTAPAISGAGLQVAPFLRGLNQQHHLGVPGSAPQIDGGAEWLPLSAVNNNAKQLNNVAANSSIGTSTHGNPSPAATLSQLIPAQTVGQSWTTGGTITNNFTHSFTGTLTSTTFMQWNPAAGAENEYDFFAFLSIANSGSTANIVSGDNWQVLGLLMPATLASHLTALSVQAGPAFGITGTIVPGQGIVANIAQVNGSDVPLGPSAPPSGLADLTITFLGGTISVPGSSSVHIPLFFKTRGY